MKAYARQLFILTAIMAIAVLAFLVTMYAVHDALYFCVEHPDAACCAGTTMCRMML